MKRVSTVTFATISLLVGLSGCGRNGTDSIDKPAITQQLQAYLAANWIDPNGSLRAGSPARCGEWAIPTDFTVIDSHPASNGDLEIRADVTFTFRTGEISGPYVNPPDLPENAGCLNNLAAVFGHTDIPNDSYAEPSKSWMRGLGPGMTLVAHGVKMTLSKWSSGWRLTAFNFTP